METLQEQIARFREKFLSMVSAEKVKLMEKSLREQKLNRGPAGIVKVGERVSDFSLPDVNGTQVRLSQLLARGPVVLKFYRGGWCPYCNLELMGYQRLLGEFQKAGASIFALSPEVLNEATLTVDKNGLGFPVATDEDLAVAKSFGLVFELDDELQALYKQFEHPLSAKNTNGLWQLPVPATYVIDQDMRVSFASVNLDYRERIEPSVVLEHIRGMAV